jgi:hypothetical protein
MIGRKLRLNLEFQPGIYLPRDLRAEVQKRMRAPRSGNVILESTFHHLVEHLEERDEVALASAIRPDQNVQGAQFEVYRFDGLEAVQDHSSQNSQVSVS